MEFRKMVRITLYARQQKRHRCIERSFGLCGRGSGWDDLGEWHWNMYNIIRKKENLELSSIHNTNIWLRADLCTHTHKYTYRELNSVSQTDLKWYQPVLLLFFFSVYVGLNFLLKRMMHDYLYWVHLRE